MPLILESPAFQSNQPMAQVYTCEGRDISPPLRWAGVPEGSRSLVLIVDDPDAPDPAAPKRTWVHWVVYNIPPSVTGLSENAKPLPKGAQEGLNDSHGVGYEGPCPPIGVHRYFHKLYALDVELSFAAPPTKVQVEAAMHGHVLEKAELIGTYAKQK